MLQSRSYQGHRVPKVPRVYLPIINVAVSSIFGNPFYSVYVPKDSFFFFLTDLIRVRLDCETITGPGIQGGATGTAVTSPRPEEVVQGSTAPNTLNRQQGVDLTALTGQKGGSGCMPSGIQVLHFIEHKYFQIAGPANPEERNAFLKYLTEKGKLLFTIAEGGGLIATLECRSLLLVDQF